MEEIEKISTFEYEDSVNVHINLPSDVQVDGNVAGQESPTTAVERQELKAASCPVAGVTVFLDRAEVKRTIHAVLKAGENEILVTGLPNVMDEDSIRVTCHGDAKILEVSFKTKRSYIVETKDPNPEQTKSERENLMETKVVLEKNVKQVKDKIELLEKEKSFLTSYGERLRPNDKACDKLVESFDKKSLDSVAAFLAFYHAQGQKLYDDLLDANSELKCLEDKIEKIDHRLDELLALFGSSSTSYDDKQVSILLEAEHGIELKLILSYVVSNASWTPLYDVRAFSRDNSLQLMYFGTIKQKTGEDWNDAKLSLSTAMPSVGGSPPDLGILDIHTIGTFRRKKKFRSSFRGEPEDLRNDCYDDLASGSFAYGLMESSSVAPRASNYHPTEVKEGITSTTFDIARPSTIKSDDSGHKVSVCQIDLKPVFEYEAVPKLVAHAFLTAKIKNESSYALLEGPANVFLDNNFLTKTSMDAVSPLEEFEVSLGVDPAVKVTYKPLKKFIQKSGVVTKHTRTAYHQEIVIKNTKATVVKIKVTDQLPKSSEEKLKVIVTEPVIPSMQKNKNETLVNAATKLTDKNHIEWNIEIQPSKTKELNLKYNIEHPANVHISGL